ncbi:MAG TPA: dTDP-4-dehydrorhamnose reductase [Acidiphilium sp.]|nr:MAG: dTDP-4-dehydrorhamnose reductase [Acidiphilium sp. 21-60-14]OYV92110.1 MAG: dTDP-4-dehydrorhamnose reductase [Acidiphilium sp. 37-60-79]OZB38972.1 MAG: dTDP-4-dehydrorhamnose reductase [Acidiphilium sp. 34-60-192]HQT88458.1 dTDP-4-dehydrorhamnose reductase [Acidiphilium sp.]HQU23283.1 dTDP-4-dehydrorhamnose reductase [Acidiphilium sp.]
MMTGPILITGASGQLGAALVKGAQRDGLAYRAVQRPAFDFDSPASIAQICAETTPGLIINAAAWTAVDAAETNQAAAWRANRDGPAALAAYAAENHIALIHVSTDYVFDGSKGAPYLETDAVAPLGVYGASKEAGERAVLDAGAQAIVLRTAWVFSAGRANFARTMIEAGRKRPQLRVVADQRGTPTAASDLAEAILRITAQIQRTGWQQAYGGIFHATNQGDTTWHGFATEIFAQAATLGETAPEIVPITTQDWPTPVRRPADSRLDGQKLKATFGISLADWRDATRRVMAEMLIPAVGAR